MKRRAAALLLPVLAAVGLPPGRALAETPAQSISFDRPEAWALKYFAAVSTFTGVAAPVVRRPGSIELGLEAGWIPRLSDSERRVGFNGTSLEDLNKTPILGRPRLVVGLPGGISAEVGWVPPVTMRGAKVNLVSAALERPFFDEPGGSLGMRVYGQLGHAKGDITCPKSVVSQPPGSDGNPLGCEAPSRDTSTLNEAGGALTGGVRFGSGELHAALGATYNDLEFQVGALTNGMADDTHLATHGWTGWGAAGAGVTFGRVYLGAEAFYSPLKVRRPPAEGTQNDGLFNVRALIRYQIR